MPEAAAALAKPKGAPPASPEAAASRITELKVSGHLMTLDSGLFCVFQAGAAASAESGLPGVRVSLPPGSASRPEAVSISTFRDDGWLAGGESAALVRVARGPAQVLVTVYQGRNANPDQAPRLQVLRLSADGQAVGAPAAGPKSPALAPADAEVVAHVQRTGDIATQINQWVGKRGSRLWIEGFAIAPRNQVAPGDIEYQAVLGRGWLSPWVEGGKFCGSRGMALPLLGLKVRLKGVAAATHDLSCHASFVDGSDVGPVPAGEACETESLAALESFRVLLRPKASAASGVPPVKTAKPSRTPAAAAVAARKVPVPARKAGRR